MLRQCSSYWSASARLCQGNDLLVPFREVDPVSINQENIAERNQQVAIMVLWATSIAMLLLLLHGLGKTVTTALQSGLNRLAALIDEAPDLSNLVWLEPHQADFCYEGGTSKYELGAFSNEFWDSVANISKDPYWDRSWIKQEVIKAKKFWILHGSSWTAIESLQTISNWLASLKDKECPSFFHPRLFYRLSSTKRSKICLA
jgi:hypothetical protein